MLDAIQQAFNRLAKDVLGFSWCLVSGYDDATHTAMVQLPDGTTYPGIPILLPFRGLKMPHHSGMQGAVLLIGGQPQVLLGVTYTTRTPIPATGMSLEEDLFVGGNVMLSGALFPGIAAELPPASALYKYAIITVSERATGLPNARPARTYQCLPSADGSLHWVQVAAAP